jgi:hypothetical protein
MFAKAIVTVLSVFIFSTASQAQEARLRVGTNRERRMINDLWYKNAVIYCITSTRSRERSLSAWG